MQVNMISSVFGNQICNHMLNAEDFEVANGHIASSLISSKNTNDKLAIKLGRVTRAGSLGTQLQAEEANVRRGY